MTDFGTLVITDVYLHQVPGGRRNPDEADPILYSEAPIDLPPLERGFIQERLRDTLTGGVRPVIEDESLEAKAPDIIRRILSGAEDIVGDSQILAADLYARQKHVSPVGLVMVLKGTVTGRDGSETCLVIAKMEHETGMQVEPTTIDGKRTYKAEYLRNLILGQGTKVFKVGIFVASGAQQGSKLAGEVTDVQQGSQHVAEYFVEFLGCQFVLRADLLTENYFKATQSFIRKYTKDDPESAAEYEIGLLSELQNRNQRVIPEQWARAHLRTEHQDEYLADLTAAGVPVSGFRKDTNLISGSIRRIKVQTARGATVLVPPPMYSDGSVSVENLHDDDQRSRITVEDRIAGMSGASGPKPKDD